MQRTAGNAAVARLLRAPLRHPTVQRYVYPDGAGKDLSRTVVLQQLRKAGIDPDEAATKKALAPYLGAMKTIKLGALVELLKPTAEPPGDVGQDAPEPKVVEPPVEIDKPVVLEPVEVVDEVEHVVKDDAPKPVEPPKAGTFYRITPVRRIHADDHILRSHLYERFGLEHSRKATGQKSVQALSQGVKSEDIPHRQVCLRPFLTHQNSSRRSPFLSGCPRLTAKSRAFINTQNPLLVFNLPQGAFLENPMGSAEVEILALHYIERKYLLGVLNMKAESNGEPTIVPLDTFKASPERYCDRPKKK